MKKERIIFLLIFSVIVFSSLINANINPSITGKTTNANVAVSITISIGEPILTIIIPKNNTYITSKNLQLNFTSENAQTIWYNLDNQANTTITRNTIFNTTQGQHTLYLYTNNSDGNKTSVNRTFTVNSNKFKVYYNKYAGSNKGISTDFNKSGYENLQGLSNIILENTNYGKMQFNEVINITDDANTSDGKCDLNTNTNISLNRIELNSTALPNFNTPATLWLYNLTLDSPRILKDGVICSSPTCVIESYTGGALKTLKFNVTGFTVYSAEETPVTDVDPYPSGGGGKRITKGFSIDKENIKISLKQGQTKEEQITIKNKGNKKINFKISTIGVEEFIKINEAEFNLDAEESKTVNIDFIAKEESIPDLYVGKLLIKGDGTEKEIPVAVEVESEEALFDVKLEIPKEYLTVSAGEEIKAIVNLYSVGEAERVDVLLDYSIKDSEGNIITAKHETIAVEKETSRMQTFNIPENAKNGNHLIYVKATYDGKVASASSWFVVKEGVFLDYLTVIKIVIGTIFIILIIIIIQLKKMAHMAKKHAKINERILAKRGVIKKVK